MIHKHQHFDLLNKTVLERIVFQPPLKADASMQDEACFLYAVNGHAKLYGADANFEFSPNKGVVMKCGKFLNHWSASQEKEPYEAVAVHFYPEVLEKVFEGEYDALFAKPLNLSAPSIQPIVIDALIQKYVESLLFYFENPEVISEEIVALKVKEIVLLLVQSDKSGNVRNTLRSLFNPIEYELKRVIHTHLFEPLSLEELAMLCNLSLSSFKRKFNETFKTTPAKYIKTKRLEKAADLLRAKHRRISDVAFECGFTDLSHFSKSFSSLYGLSPKEYQDQKLNIPTK